MSGQIESYREEIFNFLRTVTIKFEPFAKLMGQDYMNMYGLTDPHAKWNPYYINLSGEYAENDERMMVYSQEEEQVVTFDKDLKNNYPKTAALYKLPNNEYRVLEEKYPQNRGLIRTIVYPCGDIDTVLNAPNFALLGYDDSLLEANERESLVNTLKEFLNMLRERWWINAYTYEDMYAITFWVQMWQHLPLLLLTKRFQNIRTPYVHSFHIWEYLKSKGIPDYRDVLTSTQSLWLYRNIDYIRKNQGKTNNLKILAENLLGDVFVSLLYKDIYQETASKWYQDLRTNPDFLSFNYITHEHEKTESFSTLNSRLVDLDIEHKNSSEYIAETEENLSIHNYNQLPTKFLEFKKESINTVNEVLMTNVFLDNLMYRYSTGDIDFQVLLKDQLSGFPRSITIGDTILLWHYACHRAFGIEPQIIPTTYPVSLALKRDKITADQITTELKIKNNTYPIKDVLDLKSLLSLLSWHNGMYNSQSAFLQDVAENLRAIFTINRELITSNDFIYHKAMDLFEREVFVNKFVELKLFKGTFAEWRSSVPDIDSLLQLYENENDNRLYINLTNNIFDALFPLDNTTADEFLGSLRGMEKVYAVIRDLFIRLGSYNVIYLETDRDVHEYTHIQEPDITYPLSLKFNLDNTWSHICKELKIKYNIAATPAINNLSYIVNINPNKQAFHFDLSTDIGSDFVYKGLANDRSYIYDSVHFKHTKHYVERHPVYIGEVFASE